MRSGTKIAIGFVAIVAGAYYGYQRVTETMIMGKRFSKIVPGRVNLLGVNAGQGYRIVVQNQIATLNEGGADDFEAPEMSGTGSEADSVSGRRRIPIREMLQGMQGDVEALGRFVMTMNDLRESELPPTRVLWDSADVSKALDGDPALVAKLQEDLGVTLEGTPLPHIRFSSIQNGIVIRSPVQIRMPEHADKPVETALILEPYKPVFAKVVEEQYAEEAEVTSSMILGTLREQAKRLEDEPSLRENVRRALEARVDPTRLQSLAAAPERVLHAARIVINEDAIVDASFVERKSTNGVRFYDLKIDLTDEGRQRLWQYSKHRVGSQLLLVVDGIAIGAPRIEHELSGGVVTITQLPDKVLVQDAVDLMKKAKGRAEKNP